MKRILSLSLIFILANTITATDLQDININEVGELRQEMFRIRKNVEIVEVVDVIETVETMPQYDLPLSKELQEFTYQQSKEQGIQYETVLGLLYLESEFDAECESYNSRASVDRGISQINNIYQDYHVESVGMTEFDPFNPYHSIELCVKLLKQYYDYWIDKGYSHEQAEIRALGQYNRGLQGLITYIDKNKKIETPYSNIITKYKNNLLEFGSLERR